MKKCPFCAEDIQDAAIKCRFCGSMLDQLPAPAAVTRSPIIDAVDSKPKKTGRFKVCTACGKEVRIVDNSCWSCKGAIFRQHLSSDVEAPAIQPVSAPLDGWYPGKFAATEAGGMTWDGRPTNSRFTAERVVKAFLGGIILLGVPVVLMIFFWMPSLERRQHDALRAEEKAAGYFASPSVRQPPGSSQSPNPEDVLNAVHVMINRGLIKRMDLATGEFYVSGDLWGGFELDAKQNIVKVISKYRQVERGLPQVSLYESRSGKELADYGAFTGVTIR